MHTFLIAAISIDGFIAQHPDQTSTDWTSEADKKFFRERTKQAVVMVMGRKTYETIGRPLPGRITIVMTKDVEKKSDLSALKAGEVGFTHLKPEELVKELEAAGHAELAVCGGSSIYTAFIDAGLISTMYLTIEPVIFGDGVKLFQIMKQRKDFTLMETKNISTNTLLLEYRRYLNVRK